MSALTTWLTAIADAIRGKDGTALPIDHADFPAKITAIPQLDTSDATAVESDIVLGKTAFIDGEEVTGTLDVIGAVQDVLTDYDPVVGSGAGDDVFACNIDSNKSINFAFTIADTDAKEITFTNVPTGRCEVFLEITTSAAPGAITWTLNGGSVAWSTGSAPVMASGKVYRIAFFTSDSGANWDAYAAGGV